MDTETQTIYRSNAPDDSSTKVLNIPSLSLPADRTQEANAPLLPQAVAVPSSVSPEAPFIAELLRQDVGPGGTFRPAARLVLAPALRTGGLWHALPAEELRTLALMLTFLTDNGWCRPSLIELAQAMQVAEHKARSQMERLAGVSWHGNPVENPLVIRRNRWVRASDVRLSEDASGEAVLFTLEVSNGHVALVTFSFLVERTCS